MANDRTPDDVNDVDQLISVVDGIAELNDEEVAALVDDLRQAALDQLDQAQTAADLEVADKIETALNKAVEVQQEREAEVQRIADDVAARRARLAPAPEPDAPEASDDDGPEDDEQDDDDEGGEKVTEHTETTETERTTETVEAEPEPVEAEEEVEPIAASKTVVSRVAARRPNIVKPRPKRVAPEMVLRASANVPGVPAGEVLDTPEKIANTFDRALRASGIGSGRYTGPRTEVPIMSFGAWDAAEVYGEQRTLRRDARTNEQRIDAITSERALRATGGICAPLQVDYTLPILGSDARPVRDAFARFGADRGGARFLTPPTLSDVVGAVGVWTEANDVEPGSDGPETKVCAVLDCPDEFEQMVAAITSCLQVGNFRARFFPEQVRAWTDLIAIQAAKIADTRLIQKLGDESLDVDVTNELLGTTRTLLPTLDRLRAQFTSFHRLADNYPLRVLAPAWLKHQLRADLAREAPGSTDERLATADAKIESFFASRNFNVSWFMDGEAGQVFPAQGAGNLQGWPDTVVIYVYIEGTWLHLDGGMLDFGIVRDSILNGTNDMQIFSEFFEESVFHGPPDTSYRVELDVCPTGEAAGLVDTSGLCTSGS